MGFRVDLDQQTQSRYGQAGRIGRSCAPLFDQPSVVEPIWRSLAERSVALGHGLAEPPELTTDPALRIAIGDRLLEPIVRQAEHCVFVLPAGADAVRIVSRTAVPSMLTPWNLDRRRLGVAIRRITIRRGDAREDIPVDHPALSAGWWAAERDERSLWRWTDGAAVLQVASDGLSWSPKVGQVAKRVSPPKPAMGQG